MGRRYRLSEKTKRFFLITLLLTPACYQIMPEIRMALVLAAMGEAVLSADRIWARNERFPFANLYDESSVCTKNDEEEEMAFWDKWIFCSTDFAFELCSSDDSRVHF